MAYTLIEDTTDEVVTTDDRPIIKAGLCLSLECRKCGDVFDQDDAGRDIPGGHKKFTTYKCPECGASTARKWGTNREVDEEYLRLSVREAFDNILDDYEDADVDPDDAVLVGGSDVDPEDVGDTVVAAFEYYPAKGVTNFFTVDAGDVWRDGEGEHGDAYVFNNEDIDAAVEWFEGHTKPIGYPDEWDNDLPESGDDLRPTDNSIFRLVRIRRE